MKVIEVIKKEKCVHKVNRLKGMHEPVQWNLQYDLNNNRYPYLTLLRELCAVVTSNQSNSPGSIFNIEVQDMRYPFMDSSLCPFAAALQNLVCEEELFKLRDTSYNLEKENRNLVTSNIPYQSKETSMADCDSNMDTYKFSYALRLKHMAYQSELFSHDNEVRNCNRNLDLKNFSFSLDEIFPTSEFRESKDLTYSNRLRKISEQLKDEEMNTENSQGIKLDEECFRADFQGQMDSDIVPLDKTHHKIYSEKETKSKSTLGYNLNQNAYLPSNECTKTDDKEKLLDALMENIKWQSMINNSNMQTDLREFEPNHLGEAGITVIERRITHNLYNKDVR